VVLEKGGEDYLDRSCEELRNTTKVNRGRIIIIIIKREGILIGYILHRNRLLKHGRKDRRIELKGRRGRRRKLIVDDLKETTGYWKLKDK